MATRTRRRARAPTAYLYEHGPFQGVRDAPFMDDEDDNYLAAAINGYLLPGEFPRMGVRPGFAPTTAAAVSLVAQWIGQYTWVNASGVVQETTMQFLAGLAYTFNWTTNAWANVSLGGVVVSTTAPVIYAIGFSNRILFVDGVNPPFFYNGVTGTFTAISLKAGASAPDQVAYGRPGVKDAKIFFIRNNDRTRIVWSETDDPTIGYEQTGYVNYYSLTQTGSDPLYAIHGTNEGMYFFRPFSIGVIRGQVNAEYSTTATTDGVSTTVGSKSPGSVCAVDTEDGHGAIWFLDALSRPHRIVPGLGVEDLSRTCSDFVRRSDLSKVEKFWGVYNPTTGVVSFYAYNLTYSDFLFCFAARTGAFLGRWTYAAGLGFHTTMVGGLVRRASPKGVGQPSLAFFVASGSSAIAVWQKDESDAYSGVGYSDISKDNTTFVPLTVVTGHLGGGEIGEKLWNWAEAVAYEVDVGAMTLDWTTSTGGSSGGGIVPVGTVVVVMTPQSFQAGFLTVGRWLQITLTITPSTVRRSSVERIRARAIRQGDPPTAT